VKREAERIVQWQELDANYAVGEFQLKLHGWASVRRFIVNRERLRESRASMGRKLIHVPGYIATNRDDAPELV